MSNDLHTLSGAYALNALSPDEAREFRKHYDLCRACQQEVRELQDAAARMGASEAMQPPPQLKARVMSAPTSSPSWSGQPAEGNPREGRLHRLLRLPGPGLGADGVQWPVRLRSLHRGRHPSRWALHWRRGHQDPGTGCPLRRLGNLRGEPVSYDPCYHQGCDSLEQEGTQGYDPDLYAALDASYAGALEGNVNTKALDEMSDAAAHGVMTFAMTSSAVGGTAKGGGSGARAGTLEFKD